MSNLTLRVTGTLAELADLWPRGTAPGAARLHAFQCAEVLQIWCETIGAARRTRPVFVAVSDAQGEAVLLLALGIERELGVRVLRFLDGGVCDYTCPVLFAAARKLDAAAMHALWRSLVRQLPPFDVALLDKMPAEVGDLPNPLLLLGATVIGDSGHAVQLSGSWQDFLKHRLPNPSESRRRRRRLAEMGAVSFEIVKTAPGIAPVLDALFRQKSRRYREMLGHDAFDRPGYRAYFTLTAQRLTLTGPVHLSALRLGDAVIATHWGYVVGKRFYHLMPSYEGGDLRRFSPGRLLNEYLLEWAYANGLEVFDFGTGDEEYKDEYCDLTIPLHRVVLPVTRAGSAWHAVWRLRKRAATSAVITRAKSTLQRLRKRR